MQAHLTASRAVGAFPLSIATSIALEYVLGVQSEANPEPKPKSIQNYREFWINIRTLFRNLHGALDKNAAKEILPGALEEELWHEMQLIQSIIDQYSFGVTKVVYYLSNYKDLDKNKPANRWKMATFKGDHTEKQNMYRAIMVNTIEHLLKNHRSNPDVDIRVFEHYLKPTTQVETLILTHIAYDLVSSKNFGGLTLIESHTGAIKTKELWYTKYHNGRELPALPFVEALLPVFGDNEFFSPMNSKSRAEVLEIAATYNWGPFTTRDKMLYGIEKLQNPYLKDAITSFFH